MCVLGVCLVLLAAVPAVAQMDENSVSRIIFFSAKEGMSEELEAGIKKHLEWHKKNGDTWTWITWQNIAGQNVGDYGAGTFEHEWKDFDNMDVDEDADNADVQKHMGPYWNLNAVQYYAHLANVSNPEPEPSAMGEIVVFNLRQGKAPDFMNLIGKFHEAIQKTEWPVNYNWHTLVTGGSHSTFVLVLPRNNWADFAPLEKPFAAMLEEAVGRIDAAAMLEQFSDCVESQTSSITRTRLDLSYMPEQ